MLPIDLPVKAGKRIIHYIFRASFTLNGVTYYAKDSGTALGESPYTGDAYQRASYEARWALLLK